MVGGGGRCYYQRKCPRERPPASFRVERNSLQGALEGLIKLDEAKPKSALGRLEYKFLGEMEDAFGQLC